MVRFDFPKIPIIDIVNKTIPQNEEPSKYAGGYFVNQKEYQRGIVWGDKEIRGLFKTLLDGFVPPAIIVWKHEDEKKGTHYWEVIDGQQRINAFGRIIRAKKYEKITWPKGEKPECEDEANKILSEIKFRETPVIQISKCTIDEAKKYFTIINTSGKRLNSQEVRWTKYNDSQVFKLLDKIFQNKQFIKIKNFNEEVKVLKINNNRKKHEEEFTMLFRLWFNTTNSESKFEHLNDTKKDLDGFYQPNNYLYKDKHPELFLNELVKFHEVFNKALKEKDENKIFFNFYYYLIFFGLYLDGRIKNESSIKTFINQIYIIDNNLDWKDSQPHEYLTTQQRQDFMPRRSLNAASRNNSHKVYLDFLDKLNG